MDIFQTITITMASGLIGGYIAYYFTERTEDYKFLVSKRDKIANIASFFSLWIKYRGHEGKWLKGEELVEYYQELTRMSFELALWVDDEELLKDVMKRLKNEDGSQQTVELLLKVKKLISKNKKSNLNPTDITIWPADIKFIENVEK
jgi:hypothetical protein